MHSAYKAGRGILFYMLGISLNNPWHIAGLVAGGYLIYLIATGNKSSLGFGPIDTTFNTVAGDVEGIFHNSAPTALKPSPGKTTVVTSTPLAGQNTGLYQNVYSGVAFDETRRLSIA